MITISPNAQKVFQAGETLIERGKLHRVTHTRLSSCPVPGLSVPQRVARAFDLGSPLLEVELTEFGRSGRSDFDVPTHLGKQTISGLRVVVEGVVGSDPAEMVAHRAGVYVPMTLTHEPVIAANLATSLYDEQGEAQAWMADEQPGRFSPQDQAVFNRLTDQERLGFALNLALGVEAKIGIQAS